MPTNIDKSLRTPDVLPGSITMPTAAEPELEIEVVLSGDDEPLDLEAIDPEFGDNLAEDIEPRVLQSLASELLHDIDQDKQSRKDWERAYTEGLKLLGLQYEERTEPWNGACGVFHPMITEAVVRFQSETITETFPAGGPVRTKIIGKETPEKKDAAARVEADMNHELTDTMVEFRPEHEQMLWSLPATGSAFKKVYFDPSLDRQISKFVPAEDIILPYGTSDIQTCYRVTHEMRKPKNDIVKLQKAGFYRDVELGEPTRESDDIQKAKDKETGFSDLNDDRFVLYEAHVDLDLEGYEDEIDGEKTGIALPYVVTIVKNTAQILAIRRNWEENDKLRLKRQHFVHYQYIPGFGAYGFGLFHLIGGYAKSATSLLRQLVDAGTLSNLPGGLKSKGLRVKGDDTPIAPGEFRDVDVGSGTIRDNILPLPYKEPSATLAALLDKIIDEGRRFAATADVQVSDMSAQAPVGTTLALLERQLKVMTAVQARVHYSLKQELRLIANIIRDCTPESYDYDPETGPPRAKRSDYKDVDIIPVSDPNAATLSQRVVQYQAVMQMAQMAPQIYDLPQLHRNMLEVIGIKNAAKLVPLPDDMKPVDPVTENMNVLKMKPLKAFVQQDHEAHIKVHMAIMQDPIVMQTVGQNPQAPQMQQALTAHIAEHVGYAYRQKIEQQLGMALPAPSDDPDDDTPLPPDVERALANMMAQAAQQVLQKNQAQVQAQQAQQQAKDPIVQMQMQELQIKGQEAKTKADKVEVEKRKVLMDAAHKADQLQLETQKVQGQLELDSLRVGAQIKESQTKLSADQESEGVKLGIQIASDKAKNEQAARTAALQHEQIMHKTRTDAEVKRETARAARAAKAKAAKPTKGKE